MITKQELSDKALIIAEVGQNHQGDIELARSYVRDFASLGADVIKFQTRNNKYLFDDIAYKSPYDNINSFGNTYGEHREFLEFTKKELHLLKNECINCGVLFMSTPFDEPSLDVLQEVNVDMIKIASFDLGNLPFLKKISAMGKPVIMSVGGGRIEHIKASVEQLVSDKIELGLLHCVSEYPCPHDQIGMENIPLLKSIFPNITIGLSDHFNGILTGPVGYLHGARIFEKHVTYNRSWKGTDHNFALEPEGFKKFVRDIRRTPEMWSSKKSSELGKEFVFQKLGKSIVAMTNIPAGKKITLEDLRGKIMSEGGVPIRESVNFIGKTTNRDIDEGEIISWSDIQ